MVDADKIEQFTRDWARERGIPLAEARAAVDAELARQGRERERIGAGVREGRDPVVNAANRRARADNAAAMSGEDGEVADDAGVSLQTCAHYGCDRSAISGARKWACRHHRDEGDFDGHSPADSGLSARIGPSMTVVE